MLLPPVSTQPEGEVRDASALRTEMKESLEISCDLVRLNNAKTFSCTGHVDHQLDLASRSSCHDTRKRTFLWRKQ